MSSLHTLLRCPVSQLPLIEAPSALVQDLITRRAELLNRDGEVPAEFTAGLTTTDGKVFYPIRDHTPVLLPGEGIALV